MKRPLPVMFCTACGTPDTTSPLLMGVAEKRLAGNDAKAPTQVRITVGPGKSARQVKQLELSATLNAHNAGASAGSLRTGPNDCSRFGRQLRMFSPNMRPELFVALLLIAS